MRVTLRKASVMAVLLLIGSAGAGVAAAEEEAVELRLLSSWNPSVNAAVDIVVNQLSDRVEELSDGRVSIEVFNTGAVPAFRQFGTVQSGVFDLLFSHPAYHADVITVGMGGDLAVGSAAVRRECGLTQAINDTYRAETDILYIAGFPLGYGYRLYLNEKPGSGEAALEGLRIRGTEFYNPVIQGLGGSPIKTSSSEAYSAAQRGIISGLFNGQGAEGAFNRSLHEVTNYRVEPTLGETVYVLFANARVWDGLDDDAKQVLQKAIEETQEAARREAVERDKEYQERLRDAGMQVVDLEGEARELYERYYYEGIAEKFVLGGGGQHGQPVMEALECVRAKGERASVYAEAN